MALWNRWQALHAGWTQTPCISENPLSLKPQTGTIHPCEKATSMVYLRQIYPGSPMVSQKCTYLIPGACFGENNLL